MNRGSKPCHQSLQFCPPRYPLDALITANHLRQTPPASAVQPQKPIYRPPTPTVTILALTHVQRRTLRFPSSSPCLLSLEPLMNRPEAPSVQPAPAHIPLPCNSHAPSLDPSLSASPHSMCAPCAWNVTGRIIRKQCLRPFRHLESFFSRSLPATRLQTSNPTLPTLVPSPSSADLRRRECTAAVC